MILMDIRMPYHERIYEAAKATGAAVIPWQEDTDYCSDCQCHSQRDVQKSLAASMTMHLTKPIDIELLSGGCASVCIHTSCEEWRYVQVLKGVK